MTYVSCFKILPWQVQQRKKSYNTYLVYGNFPLNVEHPKFLSLIVFLLSITRYFIDFHCKIRDFFLRKQSLFYVKDKSTVNFLKHNLVEKNCYQLHIIFPIY